jgi:hypothetical protein
MRIIILQHKLVNVNLADPSSDTALGNLIRETVGAVENDSDAAGDLFADGFESVFVSSLLAKEDNRCTKKSLEIVKCRKDQPRPIQPRPLSSILAMHIPHRRRQKIHPGSKKLLDLVRTRQHTLHSLRIRNPVLPTLDSPRFSFSSDSSSVAVGHELLRLGQILSFFEVRHVDHDGVEGQGVCCQAD